MTRSIGEKLFEASMNVKERLKRMNQCKDGETRAICSENEIQWLSSVTNYLEVVSLSGLIYLDITNVIISVP